MEERLCRGELAEQLRCLRPDLAEIYIMLGRDEVKSFRESQHEVYMECDDLKKDDRDYWTEDGFPPAERIMDYIFEILYSAGWEEVREDPEWEFDFIREHYGDLTPVNFLFEEGACQAVNKIYGTDYYPKISW